MGTNNDKDSPCFSYQEALALAKTHPGSRATRDPGGQGWIVKGLPKDTGGTESKTNGDKATLGFVVANAALGSEKDTMVFLSADGVWAAVEGEVDKIDEGGRSVTRVHVLEGESRELELARMIAGGELGPSALAHARALLGES